MTEEQKVCILCGKHATSYCEICDNYFCHKCDEMTYRLIVDNGGSIPTNHFSRGGQFIITNVRDVSSIKATGGSGAS